MHLLKLHTWLSILCGMYLSLPYSMAQTALPTQGTTVSPSVNSDTKTPKPALGTKPNWIELKPEQRIALAPLEVEWSRINESQKRKWLELSKNFSNLQVDEQTKLHSRMKEWVGLSPNERVQARHNFSASQSLSAEEKQKKWVAYQALSPEDREKLQTNAKSSTPNSAALANKPQNKVAPNSKLPASTPTSAPAKAQ